MRSKGRTTQQILGQGGRPSPVISWLQCLIAGSLLALAALTQGCATAQSQFGVYPSYQERALTQVRGELKVTVSVPTVAEAKAIYGVELSDKEIQPVWIEVENNSTVPYWLLKSGLDANYFAPAEVAYAFKSENRDEADQALTDKFESLQFQNPVMPASSASGFLLTNLDEGFKAVDIDLISSAEAKSFTFTTTDPAFRSTSSRVDFENLYPEDELVHVESEAELRVLLEELPCCTTNADGSDYGDPLNLVLIGSDNDIMAAGLRRQWHPTEIIHAGSVWRTVRSFLEGTRYRYSPISPLYVFGRPQDAAAQKARGSINERNHARFWLTPIRFQKQKVWVGQVSRDIGVKYTFKSPTISTHVIDPDVDETRRYVIEDLAYSQALNKFGFVKGVGRASRNEPRFNLVDDPYFTDGLRAVLFVGSRPNSLSDIDSLEWERPPYVTKLLENLQGK